MTQVRYNDGMYENMAYAQKAAIRDYLTASGTQSPSDGIREEDTVVDVARDMIEEGWSVPGIWYRDEGSLKDLTAVINEHFGHLFYWGAMGRRIKFSEENKETEGGTFEESKTAGV